ARNECGIDEVFSLCAADRIDQRLDMAARTEHEFVVAAEGARHPVTVAPRSYVVGEAGDDEFVARDLRHIDRNAEHLELTGIEQPIVGKDIDEGAVKFRR